MNWIRNAPAMSSAWLGAYAQTGISKAPRTNAMLSHYRGIALRSARAVLHKIDC
jgi:hypothetical protein